MYQYLYTPFSQPGSIRLLQICPRNEDSKNLRCKLVEYSFRSVDYHSHLYDAVSYVWGSEDKPQSILIDNQNLKITQNLYTLLLRLQNHSLPRVLWVDAVCINQDDEKEKENQIPLMAEIYAKASRVLVWLGEAEDDSDEALKAIRYAGEASTKHLSHTELYRQPIMKLLQRPWFHRVWVLQEVAAARHILIMCGVIEIEGHAFSLGLDSLSTTSGESMIQVSFLIRGAIFRSRETLHDYNSLSLYMSSLGELIDMYHTYKATRRHDKLYALLGMCSDDLDTAGLEPNYELGWKELMCRLVKFILGGHVSVDTWEDREMAFIKSQGYIFGKVSQVESSTELGGQRVNIFFKIVNKQAWSASVDPICWTLPKPAISIQEGDFICLLQGTSKPAIVRLHDDHFVIIMIAAVPLERINKHTDFKKPEFSQSVSLTHEFSLVWNWELASREKLHPGDYDSLIQTSKWGLSETGLVDQMRNVIRTWSVAQILKGIGENDKAMKILQKAVKRYYVALGKEQPRILEIKKYATILSWAAEKGHEDVVRLQLDTSKDDVEWEDIDWQTPLSQAAANGHEAIVQQLLEVRADVKSQDTYGRTPLSWAATNGHENTLMKLLEAQSDIESKDRYGQTPLSLAAANGHEAAVKELLRAQADVESKDTKYSRTSLSWAAANGHESVVKLLLEVKTITYVSELFGRGPLSWAAENGHDRTVKLLLEEKFSDLMGKDSELSLFLASQNGHESVVKLLLATEKVNADSKDDNGRTPLSLAARYGHESIVKLLLATGKVNADLKDDNNRTSLLYAARHGHESIVKLLLATGKVNANAKDGNGWTPLSYAARHGHESIVKLLLATGKINTRSRDIYGETPLFYARMYGHKRIIKLLESSSK